MDGNMVRPSCLLFLLICLCGGSVGIVKAGNSGNLMTSESYLMHHILTKFRASGARCTTLINNLWRNYEDQLLNDHPTFLLSSGLDVLISASSKLTIEQAGSTCPHHLLYFDNAENLQIFITENENHLRKRDTYYAIIIQQSNMSDLGTFIHDHPFFSKILNAIFFIGNMNNSSGFSSIIKPVCSSLAASVHNIWTHERGPVLDVPMFKEDILDDLSCKEFKATAFAYPPRTTIQTLPDGSLKYGGYEYMIFDEIARKLRINYKVGLPKLCCQWGRKMADSNNFTGLMGDLYNGYSDIGWANLFNTPVRRQAIDLTAPYTIDNACFMVKKPPMLPEWMSLIQPFQPNLWIAYFVSLAICSLFMCLYGTLYPKAEISSIGSISYVTAVFVDASMDQTFKFNTHGMRLFLSLSLIMAYTLNQGYKGAMISALSLPARPKAIETLQELADSELSVETFGVIDLSGTTNPHIQKIEKKYSWYSGSADRLVPKLEARTISLIQSRVYLDYFIREQFTDDTGFTEMYIMDECALSYRVVFALQKYSIFRSKFGYLIMKMQESGLIGKWTKDEMEKVAVIVPGEKNEGSKPYNLRMLQGGFLLLTVGLSLALPTFVVEVIGRRCVKFCNTL